MPTLKVSLPKSLTEFVNAKSQLAGYDSPGEFVRSLIRDAQKREASSRLEQLIIDGINSGPGVEVTPAFWQSLQDDLKQRLDRKSKAKRKRA